MKTAVQVKPVRRCLGVYPRWQQVSQASAGVAYQKALPRNSGSLHWATRQLTAHVEYISDLAAHARRYKTPPHPRQPDSRWTIVLRFLQKSARSTPRWRNMNMALGDAMGYNAKGDPETLFCRRAHPVLHPPELAGTKAGCRLLPTPPKEHSHGGENATMATATVLPARRKRHLSFPDCVRPSARSLSAYTGCGP